MSVIPDLSSVYFVCSRYSHLTTSALLDLHNGKKELDTVLGSKRSEEAKVPPRWKHL